MVASPHLLHASCLLSLAPHQMLGWAIASMRDDKRAPSISSVPRCRPSSAWRPSKCGEFIHQIVRLPFPPTNPLIFVGLRRCTTFIREKEKFWEEEGWCVCAKTRGRSAGVVYYTCSDLGELEEEMAWKIRSRCFKLKEDANVLRCLRMKGLLPVDAVLAGKEQQSNKVSMVCCYF